MFRTLCRLKVIAVVYGDLSTEWLWQYNNQRTHMGLAGFAPIQKLRKVA
jgi:hypothetical protein